MIRYLQELLNIPDSPDLETIAEESIVVIWTPEDVKSRARNTHPDQPVTEEEAISILKSTRECPTDRNNITWDVLDSHIRNYLWYRDGDNNGEERDPMVPRILNQRSSK